jgi:hypothetical protein
MDGSNYFTIPAVNQATEAIALTTTATGMFILSVAGFKRVRVRCSAFTSGTTVLYLRASQASNQVKSQLIPAGTWVTATGASGAAVTATLPAAGAGLFHYITEIQIVKFAVALLTAGATPVIVTTTNLTGSPAFSFAADAALQGTTEKQQFETTQPMKSTTANTATTIVCPATTNLIWRINCLYYIGC